MEILFGFDLNFLIGRSDLPGILRIHILWMITV